MLFLVAGVSRGGEALALWQDSPTWTSPGWTAPGRRSSPPSGPSAPRTCSAPSALDVALELVPLLDGSLAVRAEGSFRRVYPGSPAPARPSPRGSPRAPAGRSGFTRGNRGYAVLPPAGEASPGCVQSVELRAPSGRLCGQVVLRPAQAGACVTGAVDQG